MSDGSDGSEVYDASEGLEGLDGSDGSEGWDGSDGSVGSVGSDGSEGSDGFVLGGITNVGRTVNDDAALNGCNPRRHWSCSEFLSTTVGNVCKIETAFRNMSFWAICRKGKELPSIHTLASNIFSETISDIM